MERSGTATAGTRPATESPRVTAESLVVQTSFIGDVVLTTPLIAELASRGPVDVVVTPGSAQLLLNDPHIRHLIRYDKRAADAGIGGMRRTAARIRAGSALSGSTPTAYVAQRSMRSAALALMAGCRSRIGFRQSPGGLLYTRRIAYRGDLHHAERLWRLAFPDGAPLPDAERLRPRLYPGEHEAAAVDAVLHGLEGEAFVVLAPGSVWGTKRWPFYPDLARRLAATHPLVVVGGVEDAPLAVEIVRAADAGRVVDAIGRLSLLGSAELMRRAALVITNDSSPLHLASAMSTPTVAVFGPTVPAFGFGPVAPGSCVAEHESLACRPCHKHGPQRCPLEHWKCMRELSSERLHQLALRTLNRTW